MKRLLFILILCVSIDANAQLRFSDEITNSQDPDIQEISKIWQHYFSLPTQIADSLYWNKTENRGDIIRDAQKGYPFYTGKHLTFNIRKMTSNIYEITTQNEYSGDNIPYIYKVCAQREGDHFKLYNYFHFASEQAKSYKTGIISYYYPHSFNFNKTLADNTETLLSELISDLKMKQTPNITYLVANTLDESNDMLGYIHTIYRSELRYAGFMLNPAILVSCRENHTHELVHALTYANFPNAPKILHEGLAVYIGGSGIWSNHEHIQFLKHYKVDDWSDYYSYETLIDGMTNPFYTVGMLLIDHAMKNGGMSKVHKLLSYCDIDKMLADEWGIKTKKQVNDFIGSLITNYPIAD